MNKTIFRSWFQVGLILAILAVGWIYFGRDKVKMWQVDKYSRYSVISHKGVKYLLVENWIDSISDDRGWREYIIFKLGNLPERLSNDQKIWACPAPSLQEGELTFTKEGVCGKWFMHRDKEVKEFSLEFEKVVKCDFYEGRGGKRVECDNR